MGNIWIRSAWRWLSRYGRDRRGNIAALTAALIIPLVGLMGLATETGSWFLIQRAEQNAADSAVLATGENWLFGGVNYIAEGQSNAAKFGFVNGSNSTTVTPAVNQNCPAPYTGMTSCMKVTISKSIPLTFSKILGYSGTGGGGRQTIIATAVAKSADSPVSDCILSLATNTDGFHVNGGPKFDLTGCAIQVNGDATCNGANSNGNAFFYFVTGSNKHGNCSPTNSTPTPAVADPYTSQYPASNIPTNTCPNSGSPGGYYQASGNYGNQLPNNFTPPSKPAALQGTISGVLCGDQTLSGDASFSGTVVIENGTLDLKNNTLSANGGTLIFSGPNVGHNFNPGHTVNDGTLDISAPTSGTWSGVAIYQDPGLTSGVDWSSAGSGLNWNVSGLIYMPKSNIDFRGAVNKASTGVNCWSIVDYTFSISGAVNIYETQSQCALAGLQPPISVLRRPILIQ